MIGGMKYQKKTNKHSLQLLWGGKTNTKSYNLYNARALPVLVTLYAQGIS